jgi:2-polyprenyl-6-methoxyphenol hydroxylase-like FAD-dependent oxidoreductase
MAEQIGKSLPRQELKGFAPVLIAGAGPVGLTLAADLAWRGVRSLVVEPRVDVNSHPRAISIGVRTMEHFRRLGLDGAIIDAGVPRNRALDVVYGSRMLRHEVFRFQIPSIQDLAERRSEMTSRIPELAASPYYKTWTAQSPLERVLRRHAAAQEQIDLRTGWRLSAFEEKTDRVEAVLVENETGRQHRISCSYLVGCDGSASFVRKHLGIHLDGRGTLGAARGVYFRSAELNRRLGERPGVMYWALAPDAAGVIYTIDGGDEWVLNRYYDTDEQACSENAESIVERAIGEALDVEILSDQNWSPRQLVAERFSSTRVFLAGDACHLFVPTGGFGMNTGIGDAVDLAWKMSAVFEGWGGPHLLAAYDTERRPVGTRNTLEAADNYFKSGELLSGIGNIEAEGAEGERARKAIAEKLPPKIKHFAPIGAHLGYRYSDSPIVVSDGTQEPAHEVATYTPTARPGHRAPHMWLPDGTSILDLFGRGFTLLTFGDEHGDFHQFRAAAENRALPLCIRHVDNTEATRLYAKRMVLVRPDGHVAWRGDAVPQSIHLILDTVRGALLRSAPITRETTGFVE